MLTNKISFNSIVDQNIHKGKNAMVFYVFAMGGIQEVVPG
jgi:hypothetical protein